MLQLLDLVFESDIARLPRTSLQAMARTLGIPTDISMPQMATQIWSRIRNDTVLKRDILSQHVDNLFAGRTSAAWFTLSADSFGQLREALAAHGLFDAPIKRRDANAPETALGAAESAEGNIYLRCLVNEGQKSRVSGTQLITQDDTTLVTVVFFPNDHLVEIRASGRVVSRMASFLSRLLSLESEVALSRIRFDGSFSIEALSDQLGGHLIEARSMPHEIVQAMGEEGQHVIGKVFEAIDSYYQSEDVRVLQEALEDARTTLATMGIDPVEIPFLTIVLAGMERIGVRASIDVRRQPLFSALRDYVAYRQGWIRFPFVVDGIDQEFTIKIGLTTDTVYFITPAPEPVIAFTRNKVLEAVVGDSYDARVTQG